MFQVPRKGRETNVFHEDLFECVVDVAPSATVATWVGGSSAEPVVIPVEKVMPPNSQSVR